MQAAHGVVNAAQVQAAGTSLEPVQRPGEMVLGDDAGARGVEEVEEDPGALVAQVDPKLLQAALGPLVGEQPVDVAQLELPLVAGVEGLEELLGVPDPDRLPLYVIEDPGRLVVGHTLGRIDKNPPTPLRV